MTKLFILIIFLMIANATYAQEPQNYVIIEEPTNVRSGPSGYYAVRGVINNGVLTVTGKTDFDSSRVCTGIWQHDKDMWLRVDLEGIEGWVKFCIVDFEGNLDDLPVAEPSSPLIHRPLVMYIMELLVAFVQMI